MHISSTDKVAGQPILAIRDLLRKSQQSDLTLQSAQEAFGMDIDIAQRVIASLTAHGYIEPIDSLHGEPRWGNTVKGNALAMASSAQPIQRKTAERKVAEFLSRVQHVNESEQFVYAVAKVVAFGSYITTAPAVNDIDLAVSLVPKYLDPDQMRQRREERIQRAVKEGKHFANIVMRLSWPQNEVYQYLKARSRIYSIHDLADEPLLASGIPRAVLFESG